MVIRDFDITPCTMRKEDPTWRFALAANPVCDGQVLRIATAISADEFFSAPAAIAAAVSALTAPWRLSVEAGTPSIVSFAMLE